MKPPFTLCSAELGAHGSALLQSQRQWAAQWQQYQYHWQQAQNSWQGAAATQAHYKLRQLQQGSQQQSKVLQGMALTLFYTAPIQQFLEQCWQRIQQWLEQLRHFPQLLIDANPVITAILRDLRVAGEFLDVACARQISIISGACATGTYSSAAPSAAEITHQFPDATILKLENNRAIVAFGDLKQAADITTFVAGVGSGDPQQWHNSFQRASQIHNATGSATIAWLDYDPPPNVSGGLATIPAAKGAQELQDFQTGLRQEYPQAKLHVLGHSYGSTVAGKAAEQGLEADSLIVVGSPGIPAHLHLKTRDGSTGMVIGALNDRDPIGFTGTNFGALHGIDPGAISQGQSNPVHTQWRLRGDHSSYFEDPEFLAALQKHFASS